jgi:hypothetical protein
MHRYHIELIPDGPEPDAEEAFGIIGAYLRANGGKSVRSEDFPQMQRELKEAAGFNIRFELIGKDN